MSFELDRETVERATMLTGDETFHDHPRTNVQALDFVERFRI